VEDPSRQQGRHRGPAHGGPWGIARSDVEAHLARLPPELRPHATLSWVGAGMDWTGRGRIADGSIVPGDPLRAYECLLEDLMIDPTTERSITRSMILTLLLLHVDDGRHRPLTPLGRGYAALADELDRTVQVMLRSVVGEDQELTQLHGMFWERSRAALHHPPDSHLGPESVLANGADRLAPLLSGAAAAISTAGRRDVLTDVVAAIDALYGVLQVRRDLLRARSDLFRGVVRPVLAYGAGAAGLDSASGGAEEALGAFVISGVIHPLSDAWRDQLDSCRRISSDVGLDRLALLAGEVGDLMDRLRDLFTGGGVADGPSHRDMRTGALGTATDILSTTVEAAERYLLADPSFRDSWEVHRWGLGGAETVTARFPAGLVLEILARHGLPVTRFVDEYAAGVEARRFAYYDHPGLPHVDSDTLGVLLRLHRFASDPRGYRRITDQHLALLLPRIGPDGRIPVWLSTDDDAVLLGEGCGVIGAGVAVGLLDYGEPSTSQVTRLAARRVLEDFVARGTAISVNYPAEYALSVVSDLLVRLRGSDLLGGPVEAASQTLRETLDQERGSGSLSPQRAALLAIACSRSGEEVERDWIDLLLRSQRSDGRWAGEPLFFVPHRGWSVTWYASDLMTSALCYDALATYQVSMSRRT
jgi:hypothetical protein